MATVALYAEVLGKRWFTPEHAKAIKDGGRNNWQEKPFEDKPATTATNATSNNSGT